MGTTAVVLFLRSLILGSYYQVLVPSFLLVFPTPLIDSEIRILKIPRTPNQPNQSIPKNSSILLRVVT